MSLIGTDIGNLFLSLCAVVGLVILHGVIAVRGAREPLNRRFLFGLRVMMLLFAGRALFVMTEFGVFRVFVLLGAALIPLSVLLLCEGLLRRHAPVWAKLWVGCGTALFAVLSLWWSGSIDPARLAGLMVFQLSGFAIGGYLVLTRDKAGLSVGENRTVEQLALSLVVLVPLAAADFLIIAFALPVQVSPLGVLILCWLAVSLGRAHVQHRASLMSFVFVIVSAGLAGWVVAQSAEMDRDGVILTLSVMTAAVLVAVLVIEAQSLTAQEQSQTLLRHMADDRSRDVMGFLRGLQAHPIVEGAAIIQARQLSDFNIDVLGHVFRARPVLRRASPGFTDGEESDHVTHLFSRFDASHILLVKEAPLTLVALSMPALATSARAEIELAALQRMAYLKAKLP